MPSRRALLKATGAVGGIAGVFGLTQLPIRSHLYDFWLVNRRNEPTSVDVRLHADGKEVLHSTVDLPTGGSTHLSCQWPRTAWSYRVAVRLAGSEKWRTDTWDEDGRICRKIEVNRKAMTDSLGPFTFRESGCPTTVGNSCGSDSD